MTQDEFNTMLRAALSDGLPSGYYTSQYNGEDIDNAITKTSQLTGRNLLDNWYFADPINQRGQTEYSLAYSYGLDRWIQNGITVTNTGDVIAISGSIGDDKIYQLLEDTSLASKTLAVSVLYGGVLTTLTGVPNTSPSKLGSNCALYLGLVGGRPYCQFSPVTTGQIVAIKLELGTQQTLARKAADGTWALIDPPPNKAEELAKCQRYFYRKKGTGPYSYYGNGYINSANGAFIFVNVPEMRVAPTVAASGNFILSIPGKAISVTSISYGGASTNGFNRISVSATSSLTSNTPVMLQADNDTSTYIDFSADL